MRGLEDGEFDSPEFLRKVSDAPYGLKDGIYEMPKEDIVMSQISTGFQLKSEGSAHTTLDSYAEESFLPTKFTPSALPISMGYQGNLGESARPPLHSHSNNEKSFSPTRFAPSIINFGIVGATAVIIYFANHLRRKFRQNKESKKEEEQVLTVKDIENKLSSICDENIVFNDKELKLEFAGLSRKLKNKIKIFFSDKDSFEIKENRQSEKLILQLNKNLLTEKVEKVIATLIEFEAHFRDDLNAKKATMAKKEEDEKITLEKARKMKELRILIQNKFKETEDKIDNINAIFEEKNDKEINQQKIEKKIEEAKKCFSALNGFQEEFKNNFDQHYSIDKEILELKKKLVEIEDKKTLERVQKEASKYVADNPEFKLPREEKEQNKDQQESESEDDPLGREEPEKVIQPPASVKLLKMQDLIILELFLLGRSQVNKIANQIQGHNSGKLNFYQMNFANELTKSNLNDFDAEFNSPQNIERFNQYAQNFDPPIVRNPENLAKNYFHNLLKETVETIYQKEDVKHEDARFKRDIESRIYFFLDYAMGDKDAMLNAYQEMELMGYSRAGLTGRGHASKAGIDDVKKLCYCLKLFKDKLVNVNNQELKDFFTNAFVKPNILNSNFNVSIINSREEIIKSDAIFVKDLIEELNRDEDKIKGIDGAKSIIINFFRNNAKFDIEKISDDNVKEKFSIIITLGDNEVLKYLQKNSDLVDEIVSLSKNRESKLSFNELRKDLQGLYEKEKMAVVERESTKMQGGSRR